MFPELHFIGFPDRVINVFWGVNPYGIRSIQYERAKRSSPLTELILASRRRIPIRNSVCPGTAEKPTTWIPGTKKPDQEKAPTLSKLPSPGEERQPPDPRPRQGCNSGRAPPVALWQSAANRR